MLCGVRCAIAGSLRVTRGETDSRGKKRREQSDRAFRFSPRSLSLRFPFTRHRPAAKGRVFPPEIPCLVWFWHIVSVGSVFCFFFCRKLVWTARPLRFFPFDSSLSLVRSKSCPFFMPETSIAGCTSHARITQIGSQVSAAFTVFSLSTVSRRVGAGITRPRAKGPHEWWWSRCPFSARKHHSRFLFAHRTLPSLSVSSSFSAFEFPIRLVLLALRNDDWLAMRVTRERGKMNINA